MKQEYIGQEVVVESDLPQLRRFAGISGRVRTLTRGGLALVEFDGADRSWYDIELDYLKVVETHEPDPAEEKPAAPVSEKPKAGKTGAEKTKTEKAEPSGESEPAEELSRLEVARLKKDDSPS